MIYCTSMSSQHVITALAKLADPEKAAFYPYFFKTGPGEYGEGDQFIGVVVPNIRKVAKANKHLTFGDLQPLLNSPIHEHRMCALLILTYQYPLAKPDDQQNIYDYYLYNAQKGAVNNWDLVDCSAHKIVGAHLLDKDRSMIYQLAQSKQLWLERISVMSTMWFIKNDDFADALKLCEHFLTHKHDLIHKVCGWMLREIGKRDKKALTNFLDTHAATMPRTMLRYAIERLPKDQRTKYMQAS